MTNSDIMEIALRQSAYDCNCTPHDFLTGKNLVTRSCPHELARKDIPLPLECDMVTYGNGIVAQTSERTEAVVAEYLSKYPAEHCFETPNIHALDDALRAFGLQTCFMAEYFLPDLELLSLRPCDYELRVLQPADFSGLYTDEWGNALCQSRAHLDMLAVGAYDGACLVGLAGCSADCDTMWQIGVDVLPAYRRRGVAAALTSRLALETLSRGKVPFYCAAWCNVKSVRNAVACGFRPAWVELTARDIDFVAGMKSPRT